jgi:hypothetical protein
LTARRRRVYYLDSITPAYVDQAFKALFNRLVFPTILCPEDLADDNGPLVAAVFRVLPIQNCAADLAHTAAVDDRRVNDKYRLF